MTRPIQKILFIEPRSPQEHIFSRVAIPRLGSLLLGTILEQQGIEVKVVVEEIFRPGLCHPGFSTRPGGHLQHLLHGPPGL